VFCGREVAAVDFAAAADAVQGVLPCSDGFSDSLSGLLCQGRCQRKSVVL
jgi:hypothetical protein